RGEGRDRDGGPRAGVADARRRPAARRRPRAVAARGGGAGARAARLGRGLRQAPARHWLLTGRNPAVGAMVGRRRREQLSCRREWGAPPAGTTQLSAREAGAPTAEVFRSLALDG